MDCLFCKIIKGDIPSYKIYEDEYTYAFLDIAKDFVGHTLVLPKKHVVNILDADSKTLLHVMETVKKISNHYVNDCGYDGVNILNNNNPAGDQSIMHLHVHIIPRKENDNLSIFPSNEMSMNLEEICNLLKIK